MAVAVRPISRGARKENKHLGLLILSHSCARPSHSAGWLLLVPVDFIWGFSRVGSAVRRSCRQPLSQFLCGDNLIE